MGTVLNEVCLISLLRKVNHHEMYRQNCPVNHLVRSLVSCELFYMFSSVMRTNYYNNISSCRDSYLFIHLHELLTVVEAVVSNTFYPKVDSIKSEMLALSSRIKLCCIHFTP